MKYRTLKRSKILEIDDTLNLNFVSSNSNFGFENDILNYNDNLSLNLILVDNHLDFNLLINNSTANNIILNIDFEILIELNVNHIIFSKGQTTYVLTSSKSQFEMDNEGILTIRIPNDEEKLSLYYYDDIFASVYSLSFTVPEDDYVPEFSIGTFDDSLYTIPRQIRHGIPIISTVPSFTTSSSSSADIQAYNNGLGKDYRTIYFRIVCNKVIENALSPNDLSSLQLKIYLPFGLDLVRPPIYVPMYLVQNITSENIAIYRASYNFYKQGFFNGLEYVDGFMYFDVFVPLQIQESLGIQFDFQFP